MESSEDSLVPKTNKMELRSYSVILHAPFSSSSIVVWLHLSCMLVFPELKSSLVSSVSHTDDYSKWYWYILWKKDSWHNVHLSNYQVPLWPHVAMILHSIICLLESESSARLSFKSQAQEPKIRRDVPAHNSHITHPSCIRFAAGHAWRKSPRVDGQ